MGEAFWWWKWKKDKIKLPTKVKMLTKRNIHTHTYTHHTHIHKRMSLSLYIYIYMYIYIYRAIQSNVDIPMGVPLWSYNFKVYLFAITVKIKMESSPCVLRSAFLSWAVKDFKNELTGMVNIWSDLVWFYGITTIVGYLMLNLVNTYIYIYIYIYQIYIYDLWTHFVDNILKQAWLFCTQLKGFNYWYVAVTI